MTILTTRDSLASIAREMRNERIKAARRGLALTPYWQAVGDAIQSGRLPTSWAGKSLPTAGSVERLIHSQVMRHFATGTEQVAPRVSARYGQAIPLVGASEKVLGRSFLIADFGGTAYFQYVDVNR